MESFRPLTYLLSRSLKVVFNLFSRVSNLVSTADSSTWREASKDVMVCEWHEREWSKVTCFSHREVN